MDDLTKRAHGAHPTSDLAAIVLAAERSGRRIDAPERVPIDGATAREASDGYDLRSAALLALVVAVLAGLLGWATTIAGKDDAVHAPPTGEAERRAPAEAAVGTGTSTSSNTAPGAAAAVVVERPDLSIGRVTTAVSGAGGAIVVVGVANVGERAHSARNGATAQLVIGDEMVATESIPSIQPGEATRVTFALDACPAGTVPLTAILDPGAVVREANERNNAVSRTASFGC